MIESLAILAALGCGVAPQSVQMAGLSDIEAAAEKTTGRPVFLWKTSRTGRYLAFCDDGDETVPVPVRDVYVLDRSTGVTTRAGEGMEWQWAVQDDTLWLWGPESLFRYDADSRTSQKVALPAGIGYVGSVAAWSSDRAVVFTQIAGQEFGDVRNTLNELRVGKDGLAAPRALFDFSASEPNNLLALSNGEWIAWGMGLSGKLFRGVGSAWPETIALRGERVMSVERIDDANAGVVYQSNDGNVALTVVPSSGPPVDLGWTDKSCAFKNVDTAYFLTVLGIRREADGYEVLLSHRLLPELPRSIHFSDHGVCIERPVRGDESGVR